MSGGKLAGRIAATLVAVALGVPMLVIAAARLGLDPAHWSGTRLSYVYLTGRSPIPELPPESARALLGVADMQEFEDIASADDLAPSYWDPDSGRVMLGAATDRGVLLRENLARSNANGVPYQVVRRKRSWSDLNGLQKAATNDSDVWTAAGAGVDAPHNRVELDVRRLDHSTLSKLSRYDGAVAVRLNSFAGFASNQPPGQAVPNYPGRWATADPVGTWYTLLTGFPLYLGSVLAALVVWWAVAVVRHRRRRRTAAPVEAVRP
jgi:hypothetical protein